MNESLSVIRKKHEATSHDVTLQVESSAKWHLDRPWSCGPFVGLITIERLNVLAEMLPNPETASILLVGGGSGFEAEFLEQKGYEVISLDISDAISRIALLRRRQRGGSWEIVICDGDHLPFKSESVTAVLYHESLHHFERPETTLSEAMRVTRLIVGSLGDPLDSIVRRLAITLGHDTREYSGYDPTVMSRKEIAQILMAHGFQLTEFRGFFDWLPPLLLKLANRPGTSRVFLRTCRVLNRAWPRLGSIQIWLGERHGQGRVVTLANRDRDADTRG